MKKFGKIQITHKTQRLFAHDLDDPSDKSKVVRFYQVKGKKRKRLEYIGYVELCVEKNRKKSQKPIYTPHSWLEYRYHGKGIGAWMYSKAIMIGRKTGIVESSEHPSDEAQRVWKGETLAKKFHIKKMNGCYRVVRKKK